MLGSFLHICTCTCTIYYGLWPPDNTSCTFITWYQSPGLGLIFSDAQLVRHSSRRPSTPAAAAFLLAVVLRPSSLPLARWSSSDRSSLPFQPPPPASWPPSLLEPDQLKSPLLLLFPAGARSAASFPGSAEVPAPAGSAWIPIGLLLLGSDPSSQPVLQPRSPSRTSSIRAAQACSVLVSQPPPADPSPPVFRSGSIFSGIASCCPDLACPSAQFIGAVLI
jgi:hypothetical protein